MRYYCIIIYVSQFWPPKFCPIPGLNSKFPDFYASIFFIFQCSRNVCSQVLIECPRSKAKDSTCAMRNWDGGGCVVMQVAKKFAQVHARDYYCAKPRPNPRSLSDSRPCRGMGTQYLWIMWEYDLTAVILILMLTQPRPCERSLSSFFALDVWNIIVNGLNYTEPFSHNHLK